VADDLLIYGDTECNAALRHELPLAIGDPLLFGIVDGRRHVMTSILERDRIAAVAPDVELHELDELGFGELRESGISVSELELELASRAAARMGVAAAIVDPEFPVLVADRLRADGIALTADAGAFESRRRVKSAAELEGIRRAQEAAQVRMAAAARLLPRGGLGPAARRAPDPDRPLAPRRALRVLGGHDEDVRRRRGSRGGARAGGAGAGRARARAERDPVRRHRA
jgi:hypothetical protein